MMTPIKWMYLKNYNTASTSLETGHYPAAMKNNFQLCKNYFKCFKRKQKSIMRAEYACKACRGRGHYI